MRMLNPRSLRKTSSPLPVNSDLNTFHAHQTLSEFMGRGVGGEGPTASSLILGSSLTLCAPSDRSTNQTRKSNPLTPSPSPRKFGESLVKWRSGKLRIFGERGAIEYDVANWEVSR